MDLGRLSKGERIASLSAILLFVFMFFDWFGAKTISDEPTYTVEGTVLLPTFLALLFTAGIALGGFLALREEVTRSGQ